jgi:hypothetical protein
MQPKAILDRLLLTTLALESAVDADDLRSLLQEREALLDALDALPALGGQELEVLARIESAEKRLLKSFVAQRTVISSSIGEAMRGREAALKYSSGRAA